MLTVKNNRLDSSEMRILGEFLQSEKIQNLLFFKFYAINEKLTACNFASNQIYTFFKIF